MDKNQFVLTDRLNAEFTELLAVTIHFLVTLAALLFEDKYFVALNMGYHLSANACSLYVWSANLYTRTIFHQKNRIKFNLCAFGSFNPVNI